MTSRSLSIVTRLGILKGGDKFDSISTCYKLLNSKLTKQNIKLINRTDMALVRNFCPIFSQRKKIENRRKGRLSVPITILFETRNASSPFEQVLKRPRCS